MPLSTGAAILSVCLLLVGLVSVQMEVQNIRTGVRVRQLLRDQELKVESLRKLQMEYNTQIAPDRLEQELPVDFRTPQGYPDAGQVAPALETTGRG
ncbi:MAG: hypothetical protein VYD81_07495 [Planctomycetota bacterium]|jgi:hypothetical protein|nr:hypothetical protein [Planctomycetota bacterium]MEC9353142.1 hypothetical protein [Planctomycetota bacterium]|tara:strand:+ start:1106 stop:1393 length:288 start_codon:yes stop_codon:yes gene_type:complete